MAAQKSALRSVLRKRRSRIARADRQKAARQAAQALLKHLPPRCRIAIYLSVHSELSTQPLRAALLRAGHQVSVPVTLRDWQMRFLPFSERTALRSNGPLRLPEPVARRPMCSARRFDVILVPLLGFDATGGRIGNGGGYYDRALAAPRIGGRPQRIGYAYAVQRVDLLPMEAFDVRLDAVVTEGGWQRFPKLP
ncbi:MAG: 5-formyltetrahydrofolate cyclo-ligase [Xanthomonadaceae bacterium]|nr:5-formyltetrahydrofolate cyclo-ligase [Xanthomonadaceae bacterium]